MKVGVSLSKYQEMIEVLQSMVRHRQARPTSPVDEMYYSLLARYHQGIVEAKDQGKPVIAHGLMVPTEIFYAMDLVPMCFHYASAHLMFVLKLFEDIFGAAKGYGIAAETCSGHICIPGAFVRGWVPRPDMIVWGPEPCDNAGKEGELLMELYDLPGYFLDRPYTHSPEEVLYYARQLEELVHTLENHFSRPMDWDKLREQIKNSQRFIELAREIYQLKKAVPSPVINRRINQMMTIAIMFWGTPEGVAFFEAIREEMKALSGKGYAPERLRLLSVYSAPMHNFKLMDWMQREHGAVIVADPDSTHWREWQADPAEPIYSLARRFTVFPCGQMQGPLSEEWLPDVLNDAREHRVDGAIFWANRGCRHGPATARLFADSLSQGLSLPTLIVDTDLHDPTFVPQEETKEKLEAFFELLAERKAIASELVP